MISVVEKVLSSIQHAPRLYPHPTLRVVRRCKGNGEVEDIDEVRQRRGGAWQGSGRAWKMQERSRTCPKREGTPDRDTKFWARKSESGCHKCCTLRTRSSHLYAPLRPSPLRRPNPSAHHVRRWHRLWCSPQQGMCVLLPRPDRAPRSIDPLLIRDRRHRLVSRDTAVSTSSSTRSRIVKHREWMHLRRARTEN